MNSFDYLSGAIWLGMLAYSIRQVRRYWRRPGGATPPVKLIPATPESLAAYQQAGESMRHYAALRFAQLTVLMAVASVLAAALTLTPLRSLQHEGLRIVALAATAAFLVMQERAVDHWKSAMRAATTLETQWGTRMFLEWKDSPAVSATNATRVVHLLIGLLWWLVLDYFQ